jgi:hypothetical protein
MRGFLPPPDVDEIVTFVNAAVAPLDYTRWMSLRREAHAEAAIQACRNAALAEMSVVLRMLAVEFWSDRKGDDGVEVTGQMPVLETMVVEQAIMCMGRGDSAAQIGRALRASIKTAHEAGPDMEADSDYGQALFELNPNSSKLGDVAKGKPYRGLGQVESESGAVEAATCHWEKPKHRSTRVEWRKYSGKLMRAAERHKRYHLSKRISDFNAFLDTVANWAVAAAYIEMYFEANENRLKQVRDEKIYTDAWMTVMNAAVVDAGGPGVAALMGPTGAAMAPAADPKLRQRLLEAEGEASMAKAAAASAQAEVQELSAQKRALLKAPAAGGATGAPEAGKGRGPKCFVCRERGHVAMVCPTLSDEQRADKRRRAEEVLGVVMEPASEKPAAAGGGVSAAEAAESIRAKAARIAVDAKARADAAKVGAARTAKAKAAGLAAVRAAAEKKKAATSAPLEANEVEASHAVSRADWSAAELAAGYPTRAAAPVATSNPFAPLSTEDVSSALKVMDAKTGAGSTPPVAGKVGGGKAADRPVPGRAVRAGEPGYVGAGKRAAAGAAAAEKARAPSSLKAAAAPFVPKEAAAASAARAAAAQVAKAAAAAAASAKAQHAADNPTPAEAAARK